MNLMNLIYDFLIIGLLSFGGGYTTIPMVKDIVDKYDVLNMEMLENFIAIAESTPGPIAINLATFVGNEVAGFWGGVLATLFEILPAFIIIIIFVTFFKKYIENKNVKFALSVVRPCIVGMIMSVGITLFIAGLKPCFENFVPLYKRIKNMRDFLSVINPVDPYYTNNVLYEINSLEIELNTYKIEIIKYLLIAILVVLFMIVYKKVFTKKISSIKVIIFGAFLGIVINHLL